MHHELSYTLDVPRPDAVRLPDRATRGWRDRRGRRPTVLEALPAGLVERFEREGWLLTRSYNDEIGASFAEAFGTEDRAAVERYCRANMIETAWQADGGLRTRQRRPPWCATRSPAGAAGSTRSPSSTSGRSTPRCATTWSTSTATTGCRSTPASATATRSARTWWRCSTRSTRPTPSASRGSRVTCCWSTTSAPRTAASPTPGRGGAGRRWPTRCASPELLPGDGSPR